MPRPAATVGKTLLARELRHQLRDCDMLSSNSFYRDLSLLAPDERGSVNFDTPEAIDWDLLLRQMARPLAGEQVAVPRYDFSTHTRRANRAALGPCEALVVEGLFALWDERLCALLDLGVFLDVPNATCLARRIARDTATRGRTESSVREQWRSQVAPMYRQHVLPTRHRADLVISGVRPSSQNVREIRHQLFGRVATGPGRRDPTIGPGS